MNPEEKRHFAGVAENNFVRFIYLNFDISQYSKKSECFEV